MSDAIRQRTEVHTLHEILEELDYYTLLQIEQSAGTEAVNSAFRDQTRRLHPDRYFALEADDKEKAQEIFRRINEAWRTLKDDATRKAYDKKLRKGGDSRLGAQDRQLAERERKKGGLADAVEHPTARTHWLKALADYKAKNYQSALVNAEVAFSYEQHNRRVAKFILKMRALQG